MNERWSAADSSLDSALPAPDRPLGEWLLDDQPLRWRRGLRVGVEAYRKRYPALADAPEMLLDLIYNEKVQREHRGETPRLADYLERFPEFGTQIGHLFALDEAVQEEFSGVEPDATPPPRSEPQPDEAPVLSSAESR